MGESRFFHFIKGDGVTELPDRDSALGARKDCGFVWLHYVEPEPADLWPLASSLEIHRLSIEDCFDEDYLPKIDIFPGYVGILFNDFLNGKDMIEIREVNLFLGKDFIISVLREESAKSYDSGSILSALEDETVKPIFGPARVMHAILDRIIDKKFSAVETIGDSISAIEDSILEEGGAVDNAAMHEIRQKLMIMRKSLFHEREILARICRRDSALVRDVDIAYFSDLYDHLAKFVELVESNRETMTNLVQIQLSMTNNAMAMAANRTNRSISRLTWITTIFMPLGLLAGIGGMSEWTAFTGPENWKISYPILFGAMTLIGVGNFLILRWYDKKKQ